MFVNICDVSHRLAIVLNLCMMLISKKTTVLLNRNTYTNMPVQSAMCAPNICRLKCLASGRLDNDWRQLLTINCSNHTFNAITQLRFSACRLAVAKNQQGPLKGATHGSTRHRTCETGKRTNSHQNALVVKTPENHLLQLIAAASCTQNGFCVVIK